MKKYMLLILLIGLIPLLGVASPQNWADDVSGTWVFSVEFKTLDPVAGAGTSIEKETFVVKQQGGKLTGIYTGLFGEKKMIGSVKDKKAVFVVEVFRDGQNVKATYSGTIETPAKMTGTLEYVGDPDRPQAKWTAAKKDR